MPFSSVVSPSPPAWVRDISWPQSNDATAITTTGGISEQYETPAPQLPGSGGGIPDFWGSTSSTPDVIQDPSGLVGFACVGASEARMARIPSWMPCRDGSSLAAFQETPPAERCFWLQWSGRMIGAAPTQASGYALPLSSLAVSYNLATGWQGSGSPTAAVYIIGDGAGGRVLRTTSAAGAPITQLAVPYTPGALEAWEFVGIGASRSRAFSGTFRLNGVTVATIGDADLPPVADSARWWFAARSGDAGVQTQIFSVRARVGPQLPTGAPLND